MRRILKALGALVLLLLVLALGALAVLFVRYPRVGPAPTVKVAGSAAQIARGAYLANHVTVCMDCHSKHDQTRYANPVLPGTLGMGGESFGHKDGFPGELRMPNLTPAALASWSDGEVMRAFTSGVSRDGHPLFALMPYGVYRNLSREDAEALIAYLRALEPRANEVPRSELDFPLNLIVRTMPAEATLRERTPEPGPPEYGRYMAPIAGCQFCHTPESKPGTLAPGMDFAGGHDFGTVHSANITPDPLTGIGNWRKEDFIARFRGFANGTPSIGTGDNNTVMPWTLFAGMTDEDLGAIYDYLRTVPPVRHAVEKWPAAAEKPAS